MYITVFSMNGRFFSRLIKEYNNQHSFIFYSKILTHMGLIFFYMWKHGTRKRGKDKTK